MFFFPLLVGLVFKGCVLSDFLNYLGLRKYDGTPKAGWFAFVEEAEKYLEQFQESE